MIFVISQIINETKIHTLYLACPFINLIELRPHRIALILGNVKMTLEFRR